MRRLSKAEALVALREKVSALASQNLGPCVMCSIARGLWDPELVVAEDPRVTVVVDRFASSRGHLLCILRRHEEHVAALSVEEYLELQRWAHRATQALARLLSPRRIYIAALGAPSEVGTSFPHVHVHVVPLVGEDEDARPARVFSWTQGVYVYDEGEAEALATEIRGALAAPA